MKSGGSCRNINRGGAKSKLSDNTAYTIIPLITPFMLAKTLGGHGPSRHPPAGAHVQNMATLIKIGNFCFVLSQECTYRCTSCA